MSLQAGFDRPTYLIGLFASAVYVFVLGYLATREYLCSSVAGMNCPQSPFKALHVIMHSGFLLYLLLHSVKISQALRWKWYLLCVVVFIFITLTAWQILSDAASIAVYAALVSSIFCYIIFLLEKSADDNIVRPVKAGITVLVLIGCAIFLRIANVY